MSEHKCPDCGLTQDYAGPRHGHSRRTCNEVAALRTECICAKDCPATEHDYPPIEVDETLTELFAEVKALRAEVERMRPVVDAAVRYDEADDASDGTVAGDLNVSMRLAELVEEIIEYRASEREARDE